MNEQKIGKIYLSNIGLQEWSKVAEVFSMLQFVPFEIQRQKHGMKMTGFSARFDVVGDGEKIPEYDVWVERGGHGWPRKVEVRRR
jgi:hypothetical protein